MRNVWKGWGDFLGTKSISDNEKAKLYYDFDLAKRNIKRFKFKSRNEYILMFKHSKFHPLKPDRFYKNKWKGWSDFLGNNIPAIEVLKRYIKIFFPHVNTFYMFEENHPKMNYKIPYDLRKFYNIINFSDVFGYDKFLSYNDAILFLKDKNFKSLKEYKLYINKNNIFFLPKSPKNYYGKEFKSLSIYFSNRLSDIKNVSIETFVRYMKMFHKIVTNSSDYKNIFIKYKISTRIPKRPDAKYNVQWKELVKLWKD